MTAEKFNILGTNYVDALREHIDDSEIPVEYGGMKEYTWEWPYPEEYGGSPEHIEAKDETIVFVGTTKK